MKKICALLCSSMCILGTDVSAKDEGNNCGNKELRINYTNSRNKMFKGRRSMDNSIGVRNRGHNKSQVKNLRKMNSNERKKSDLKISDKKKFNEDNESTGAGALVGAKVSSSAKADWWDNLSTWGKVGTIAGGLAGTGAVIIGLAKGADYLKKTSEKLELNCGKSWFEQHMTFVIEPEKKCRFEISFNERTYHFWVVVKPFVKDSGNEFLVSGDLLDFFGQGYIDIDKPLLGAIRFMTDDQLKSEYQKYENLEKQYPEYNNLKNLYDSHYNDKFYQLANKIVDIFVEKEGKNIKAIKDTGVTEFYNNGSKEFRNWMIEKISNNFCLSRYVLKNGGDAFGKMKSNFPVWNLSTGERVS